jgi:hypothetical protein
VWLFVKDKGWTAALVLGVVGGLATSTKYNGALVLVAGMAYYFIWGRSWRRAGLPLLMGVVAVAVFAALNPVYWGSPSWAWKVFTDTLGNFARGASPATHQAYTLGTRTELVLAYVPYVAFIIPVLALLIDLGRSPMVAVTAFWSGALVLGNTALGTLFVPHYATPPRVGAIVLLAALALEKMRRIAAAKSAAGAVSQAPPDAEDELERRGREGPGSAATGRGAVGGALLLAATWAAVAALAALASDLPAWILAGGALLGVFAGARRILSNSFAAAAVVLPLALLVPWSIPPSGYQTAAFSLAAVLVWFAAAQLVVTPAARYSGVIASLAACVAFLLSPHVLVLLVLAALWCAATVKGESRVRTALLLLAPAGVGIAVQWALGMPAEWVLDWRHYAITAGGDWSLRAWSEEGHGQKYNQIVFIFGRLAYLPVLVPFAALAWSYAKKPVVAWTVCWGALLVAGTLVFGEDAYFQYSFPMQIGILVPAGIAGMMTLGAAFPRLGVTIAKRP